MKLALLLTAASLLLLCYAPYPWAGVGFVGTLFIGIPTAFSLMVRIGLSDLIDGKPNNEP